MSRRTVNIINIRPKRKNLYVRTGCNDTVDTRKANKIYLNDDSFRKNLERYLGQTVTVFIVSGGESGSGFTGVLLGVEIDHIRILTNPVSGPGTYEGISLGSIANIPIDKIAAFVHNAI
jgi:hypothetical protein